MSYQRPFIVFYFSLYDGFPSRSMSRILWQDLTLTTTDTAIVEEEYTERVDNILSRFNMLIFGAQFFVLIINFF